MWPLKKRRFNPRYANVFAALGKQIVRRQLQVERLLAAQQELLAKHTALGHWARALEGMIAATQPLRAAALAAARRDGGGGGGAAVVISAAHLEAQEEVVRGCLSQLRAARGAAEAVPLSGALGGAGGGGGGFPALEPGTGCKPDPGAASCMWDALQEFSQNTAALAAVNPVALMEGFALQLDTLAPLQRPVPNELWAGCVAAMRLAPQQARVMGALLEAYAAAVGPLLAERDALLAQARRAAAARAGAAAAGGGGGAADDAEELLAEAERCNVAFVWQSTSAVLALWSEVLTAEQAAAAFLSAWPFVPMMTALGHGFKAYQRRQEADNAAAAAAAAAAATTDRVRAADAAGATGSAAAAAAAPA
ncbi:MAG: hypothetical protein J3K34DRAFT_497013 [Monoraphidium minutum]|nr:MAG: hypothetical protein J3K34DRAFT_497013 [Monoraphidium minutum]